MRPVLSEYRVSQCVASGGMVQEQGGVFWLHRRTDARSKKIGRIAPPVLERLLMSGAAQRDVAQFGRYISGLSRMSLTTRPTPIPDQLLPNKKTGLCTQFLSAAKHTQALRMLPHALNHFRNDHDLAARPRRMAECQPSLASERLRRLARVLGPDDMRLLEHILLSDPSAVSLAASFGESAVSVEREAGRIVEAFLNDHRAQTQGSKTIDQGVLETL